MLSIKISQKFCRLVKSYCVFHNVVSATCNKSLCVRERERERKREREREREREIGWLVVLGFNATLTAKVIPWRGSWLSHTSTNTTFLSKATDYFSHMLLQRYEQFLLFPQCFQMVCLPGASKGVIVWKWVNLSVSNTNF